MAFTFKVKNNGLTNSAAVQIKFDLNYDTVAEGALYNLGVKGIYEKTKSISSNSEWSALTQATPGTDVGDNHSVSFTHTISTLARRTDYEWSFVIEKSKNLLIESDLKDISGSLTIDFQLVDSATKDELKKYGAPLTETVTIGAGALGNLSEDEDEKDEDDGGSGGSGGSDDDDDLSDGAVVAIVVIVVIIVLVIIGVIVVWVVKKSKHSSGENYAGNQEMSGQQAGNVVPPNQYQGGPGYQGDIVQGRPGTASNYD